MSQYYDIGDETLWNPSNEASRLFLGQVSLYQAELGLPSGIGPMQADECQIDPVMFKEFVDALLAWHRRRTHAVMAALSEGFVATVLVLAERAAIEVNWQPSGSGDGGSLKDLQRAGCELMSVSPQWRGGLAGRLRSWQGEKARLGLGQDAAAGQALELDPDVVDVVRRQVQVHRLAHAPSA
jgi:hypothetical protein